MRSSGRWRPSPAPTHPATMKIATPLPARLRPIRSSNGPAARPSSTARTGMVYSVSAEESTAAGTGELLTEDRLRYEAANIMRTLGWTEGALQGLGFRQEQPPALESTGIYTITWSQYDATGAQQDGSIVLMLDGSTGLLLSFSAWPGNDCLRYRRSDNRGSGHADRPDADLPAHRASRSSRWPGMARSFSLNRRVTEELKVVTDKKIVKDHAAHVLGGDPARHGRDARRWAAPSTSTLRPAKC